MHVPQQLSVINIQRRKNIPKWIPKEQAKDREQSEIFCSVEKKEKKKKKSWFSLNDWFQMLKFSEEKTGEIDPNQIQTRQPQRKQTSILQGQLSS